METANTSLGQLSVRAKHIGRRLLTIGENRLELLAVEVQEERMRLLYVLLLALGAALFFVLAGVTITALVVVVLWSHSHIAALLTLTGVYAAAGYFICRRLGRMLREWRSLSASREQLRKDRECLGELLS